MLFSYNSIIIYMSGILFSLKISQISSMLKKKYQISLPPLNTGILFLLNQKPRTIIGSLQISVTRYFVPNFFSLHFFFLSPSRLSLVAKFSKFFEIMSKTKRWKKMIPFNREERITREKLKKR